ncbi:hypothetical protein DFH29DRAFT_48418 [Suillus ampliporus]|nr:hypothetical protein DFH29DRAFT_48418 [Suillus ampliporus]
MDVYTTQLDDQLGAADGPRCSQECIPELLDVTDTLKQRLREAKSCAEEERRMKNLDRSLNMLLFGAGLTAYINKFATMQSGFPLYPRHTTLVAGINDVFQTITDGTFTSGTFLSVFAAPSFTFLVLQAVIDACLSVPPFVVAAAIFGKWVLGHFASTDESNDVQARRRPLHDCPQHVRARILSWLDALPMLFGLSQALHSICWLFGRDPFVASCMLMAITFWCSIIVYVFKKMTAEHLTS